LGVFVFFKILQKNVNYKAIGISGSADFPGW